MKFLKKGMAFVVFLLVLLSYSNAVVNADDFDDIPDVPITSPITP